MAHGLIIGMTMSGKTTLAKRMAKTFKAKGYGVIVLDPLHDPEWCADFQTDDLSKLLTVAKASRQCFIFIDEAGENCAHHDTEAFWLATQSRHWGHSVFFISQRAQMLSPTIRNQAGFAYVFKIGKKDVATVSEEWGDDEILQANKLGPGEYLYCPRFGGVEKFKLF